MLRSSLIRSRARVCAPLYTPAQSQWLLNRPRTFADNRKTDETVLPGSLSTQAPNDIPQPPKIAEPAGAATPVGVQPVPKTPPTPEAVGATVTEQTTSEPPPKQAKSRAGRFLTTALIVTALGYAGGVYYSLVSDNFHDFFTEYVPGGEDAVAYIQEREFKKRFPARFESKNYPQIRGENKIAIGRTSGLSPRTADQDKTPRPADAHQNPSDASRPEKNAAVEKAKNAAAGSDNKAAAAPKLAGPVSPTTTKTEAAAAPSSAAPVAPVASSSAPPLLDNLSGPSASEPVVQDVIKMLNDIITVVGSDPAASKYQSTINQAKAQVQKIIGDITTLKAQLEKEAADKIQNAHVEFDTAAKELVRRLQSEMTEQESHWREEYEGERERLAKSYNEKLSAELDVVRKVAEQRARNALIEQEIELSKRFAQSVRDRVEQEREGRLSKLDQLSTSVSELEKLTGAWNSVVDANLATQHLHVALEAVKAAVNRHDHPTPFINELAALKEIAASNDVVNAAIASIPPTAYQRGIPTPAHLIERFRRVSNEVRKAALLPTDAGVASHAASAVLSRFLFSKRGAGMPEGEDVEAVLGRTEVLLEEGDLDGAAREMNGLSGWAGVLSRDWVGECRRVLETKQALDVIATEARLQSLLVD